MGWENLSKPAGYIRSIKHKYSRVSAAYQRKNFGLCRFLVQFTSRTAMPLPKKVQVLLQVFIPCYLTPQGFLYAPSWTNIVLSSSYLAGMLLERVFTALDLNNVAYLPYSFQCLPLFCYIKHSITVLIFTFKLPPLLSPSLR